MQRVAHVVLGVVGLLALAGCPPPGPGADGGSDFNTLDAGFPPPPPPPPDAGDFDAGPADAGPINSFTTVEDVTAASGPLAGGDRVAISGQNFSPEARVYFGEVEADQVLFSNVTRLTCRVPPGNAPGPVDVRVVSAVGIGQLDGGYTYFSPITVFEVDPSHASTTGGTTGTIVGESLSAEMVLLVGGRAASNIVVSDDGTSATFVFPPGDPGRVDVEVADGFGTSELPLAVTYEAPLTLTAVAPQVVDAADVAAGTHVDLLGSGFFDDATTGDAVSATIGVEAAARVNLISEARLRVGVPAASTGLLDVTVARGAQSATLPGALLVRPAATGAFTLTGVLPTTGDTAGGTQVVLVGDGLTTVTGITVGGAAATSVAVQDDRTVTFTAPAGAVGPAPIVVSRADASTLPLDGFSYIAPVVVTSVLPGAGTADGGDTITLTGRGFTGTTVTVTFAGVAGANVVVTDDTTLSVVAPPGSPGSAAVVVTVDGRTSTSIAAYKYEAPLRVLGTFPSRGGMGGGTYITVTGSGFTRAGLPVVRVDGNPGLPTDVQVLSDSRLVARTPPGSPGVVDVTVDFLAIDQSLLATATAAKAFTYFDPSSLVGGTRGGPINGAVYVTVIDATSGFPIPGMLTFVGTDGTPVAAGVTNMLGQATISSPLVVGPQTVSAVGDGFASVAVVDVNATEITMFTFPTGGGEGEGEGELPPPATIRGRVFGFAKEFFDPAALDTTGCNAGSGKCEIAIAIVETTTRDEFSGNPDPGADNIVFEEGGSYFIASSRPGRLAVVATAGIFDVNNGSFRRRQMGVRREVFPQLGVDLIDQDIELTIDLDDTVDVALTDAPMRAPLLADVPAVDVGFTPTITRVATFLQFGGEGSHFLGQSVASTRQQRLTAMPHVPGELLTFIAGAYTTDGRNEITSTGNVQMTARDPNVRGLGTQFNQTDLFGNLICLGKYFVVETPDGSRWASLIIGISAADALVLQDEPPFSGASLVYHIGNAGAPSSEVIQDGSGDLRGGLTVQPVLRLPEHLSPLEGGAIRDRMLHWKSPTGQLPSVHQMYVYEATQLKTVWILYVDGPRGKIPLPRVPTEEAFLDVLPDLEAEFVRAPEFVAPKDNAIGVYQWQHESYFVPGLDYNNFSFLEISGRGRRSSTQQLNLAVYGGD